MTPRKRISLNSLLVGNCDYEMTDAYRAGAQAMRRRAPHFCNPFPRETQAYLDWDAGHTHEAAGEHLRFGIDVIACAPAGRIFNEDPSVVRDEWGVVVRSAPMRTAFCGLDEATPWEGLVAS